MRNLTLFIPGLLGLVRDLNPEEIPRYPALETLLARSKVEKRPKSDIARTLCQLFKAQIPTGADAPIAAICRLVDDDQNHQGIWMRADPVHLAADRKGVVLMDESSFTLDQHDALVLAADIKEILSDHGYMIEAPTTSRWYIQLNEFPGITTTPVHEVVGRDIHQYMPTGDNKQSWIQMMNEIQMVMHANPINDARQQQGELPVNSIWFWGAGELPKTEPHRWSRIFTDDVITRGLARLTNTDCLELPENYTRLMELTDTSDNALAVMIFGLRHVQYHDLEGWLDLVHYLEEFWFTEILNDLKTGALENLKIVTKSKLISVSRSSLYKFWHRPKPVNQY